MCVCCIGVYGSVLCLPTEEAWECIRAVCVSGGVFERSVNEKGRYENEYVIVYTGNMGGMGAVSSVGVWKRYMFLKSLGSVLGGVGCMCIRKVYMKCILCA